MNYPSMVAQGWKGSPPWPHCCLLHGCGGREPSVGIGVGFSWGARSRDRLQLGEQHQTQGKTA